MKVNSDYSYLNQKDLYESSDDNDSSNVELIVECSETDFEESQYYSDDTLRPIIIL